MKNLVLVSFTTLFAAAAFAQPQWRFHLAFEDATGARDTIWLIWDTTATTGSQSNPQVDTALGEGAVEMDQGAFNVWVYNWELDSTKTTARPYTTFPSHSSTVYAFNHAYPLVLRWDTTLFHASYLPDPAAINSARMDCGYFFWNNNHPDLHAFNMLLDDSVVVQGPDQEMLFPLGVGITHGSTLLVPEALSRPNWLSYYADQLVLEDPGISRVQVVNMSGQLMLERSTTMTPLVIDTHRWAPTLYFVRIETTNNQIHHGKFLVTR